MNTTFYCSWIDGKEKRSKLAEYHALLKYFDSMTPPLQRHNYCIEITARIPLDMKVESRVSTHLLAFPNSSARITFIFLRGPVRKIANLEDEDICWEK